MAAAPPVLPPPPGAPPPQAAAGSPSWFSVLVVVGASVTTLAGGLVVFVLHLRPVLKAAERAAAAAEVAARQMEVAALVRHGVGKRRVTLVQHAAVRQNGGRQHCTQPLSCHRAADLPCWRLSPLPHPVAPANPGPPSRNWSCFIQSLVRCFAAGDGEDGTGDAGGHAADVPGHAGAPPPPPLTAGTRGCRGAGAALPAQRRRCRSSSSNQLPARRRHLRRRQQQRQQVSSHWRAPSCRPPSPSIPAAHQQGV